MRGLGEPRGGHSASHMVQESFWRGCLLFSYPGESGAGSRRDRRERQAFVDLNYATQDPGDLLVTPPFGKEATGPGGVSWLTVCPAPS